MRWLGRHYPDADSTEDRLTIEELRWHYWVADNLEELFSVRLPLRAKGYKKLFNESFSKCISWLSNGDSSHLAHLLGISKFAALNWDLNRRLNMGFRELSKK